MTKPFTEDDLANQLNHDITWRIREISDLKSAMRNADSVAKSALLRAITAICYAHWEGHVRFSAQKFLTHIALRKLQFSTLSRQFLRNHFLPRLSSSNQKSLKERSQIVDDILAAGDERYSKVNDDLIDTRANLNSDVLKEICHVCCVDPRLFEDYHTFIDIFLLKRRNAIAHGQETLVGLEDLDELTERTIVLMRMFSNALQTIAYLRSYKTA